ncbi:MAG: hypothetical protein ACOCZV_02760 [Nanoarchaeota archaeon]
MIYNLHSLLEEKTVFENVFSDILFSSRVGFEEVIHSYLDVLHRKRADLYIPSDHLLDAPSRIHSPGMVWRDGVLLELGVETDSISLYLAKFHFDVRERPESTVACFGTDRMDDDRGWRTNVAYGDGLSRTRAPSLYTFADTVRRLMDEYKPLAPVIETSPSTGPRILTKPSDSYQE